MAFEMLGAGKKLRQIIGDRLGAEIVEFQLEKALKDAKDKAGAPTSQFYDPQELFMGREWLTKRNVPLSNNDLRAMARNPILGSIIQTRLNQVASFCTPQTDAYDPGYVIKSSHTDDGSHDTAKATEISDFMYHMGLEGYGEGSMELFVRKFIRDSLILDQACAEIVPMRNKQPGYIVCVDSGTIRLMRSSLKYALPADKESEIWYCQVMDDAIVTEYTYDQMIFGVRNPQTEMSYCGYGMSEMELLIRTVTTILNHEKFNAGQLTQGGTSKGVFTIAGDVAVDDIQFASFKRDFREAVRNAADAWRPPVLRVSKDSKIEWIQLDRANRDMEFSHLFDFLVKQSCGVYQISPEEINWQVGITGASATFGSDHAGKVAHSQRKGLKPLLRFLEQILNTRFIKKIDPLYRLEYVGINTNREMDSEIHVREVQSYKTLNEVRAELNMKPLKGGDIVMSQLYQNQMMLEQGLPPVGAGGGKKPGASPKMKPGSVAPRPGGYSWKDTVEMSRRSPTMSGHD